jgi:hypothetical protein
MIGTNISHANAHVKRIHSSHIHYAHASHVKASHVRCNDQAKVANVLKTKIKSASNGPYLSYHTFDATYVH